MKDLKERTLRGGVANLCAQGAVFVIRVGSLMVLARLLDPKDFGLVGMVTVVTGVFGIFREAGLSLVTIQRTTITDEQVSTLFWINMLVGTALGVISLGLAPILVSFYEEPRLFWITAALATGFLFNAAGVQHSALLQRNMRFATLSLIEISALIVSVVVGIGLAIGGYGYWALVGMAVVAPAVSALCLWPAAAWVPGAPHRGVGIRSMIRFGGTATLNGLVVYLAYNFEKVLLARYWGAEALGIYGRAYQLINIPTENLNSASSKVAFAALSRLQNHPDRFRNYFLKGYSLVLSLTLPVTIACALFARDIIFIVLGDKWEAAIPIFQLLTPTIVVFALINPMWWLLSSVGLLTRSLRLALVIAPLVIGAYVVGLPYGPTGVALAYSCAMTLWVIPHILWCIHGTVISIQDILSATSRPFLAAIFATAVAFICQQFYAEWASPLVRLVIGGSILACAYLWMLLCVMGQKALYLDLLQSMRKRSTEEMGETRSC